MEAFAALYAAVEAFPAPTIAVCVGNVVGAGAELAAGCDLRVGGDNLKLAWAGAQLGVPVGPARLAPLVGLSRAKELIFTGRVVGDGGGRRARPAAPHRARRGGRGRRARARRARSPQHPPEGMRRLKRMFRELEARRARVAYENELLVDFQREGAGLPRRAARRASAARTDRRASRGCRSAPWSRGGCDRPELAAGTRREDFSASGPTAVEPTRTRDRGGHARGRHRRAHVGDRVELLDEHRTFARARGRRLRARVRPPERASAATSRRPRDETSARRSRDSAGAQRGRAS